jgi:hypothetical protein
MDRANFIPTSFLNSYTPLLYRALLDTEGAIAEFGMGDYSTYLLHATNRKVLSFDTDPDWFQKFSVSPKTLIRTRDWLMITRSLKPLVSVFFIDQAPGESREQCIAELSKDFDGIVVAHDTEPAADFGYKMRQHFSKFKYMVEVRTTDAWATALSNTVDVTKWRGDAFGDYIVL